MAEAEFSEDQVRRLAALARIGIGDDEVAALRDELGQILEHIGALQSVDTDGIPPTANGADLVNVDAEDVARPPLPVEAVLANAPQRENDYFRVHAVLE